ARAFRIQGGYHHTVLAWSRKYDGTLASLDDAPKGHRRSVLSPKQIDKYVTGFLLHQRRLGKAVTWLDIKAHVDRHLNMSINLVTLRSYGRKLHISVRPTREVTQYSGPH